MSITISLWGILSLRKMGIAAGASCKWDCMLLSLGRDWVFTREVELAGVVIDHKKFTGRVLLLGTAYHNLWESDGTEAWAFVGGSIWICDCFESAWRVIWSRVIVGKGDWACSAWYYHGLHEMVIECAHLHSNTHHSSFGSSSCSWHS